MDVFLFQEERKSKIWHTNIELVNNDLQILLEIPLTELWDKKKRSAFDLDLPFLLTVRAQPFSKETLLKNNEDRHIYKSAEKQIEIIFCTFNIDPEITKIKNVFRDYQKFNLQSKYFLTPQAQQRSRVTFANISKKQNQIYLIFGNPPADFLDLLKNKENLILHLPKIKTTEQLNISRQQDFYRYLDYDLPFWSLKQDKAKAKKVWQAISPFFKVAYYQRKDDEQQKEHKNLIYRYKKLFLSWFK